MVAIVSAGFPGQVREVGWGGVGGLHYRIDLEGGLGRGVREGGYLSCGGRAAAAWMEEVAAIVSAGFPGQVREVGGGLGGLEYLIDLEERHGRDIREGWYCMGGGWWLL